MAGYTVIDVETTGLSPEQHDRIVEVGVVYVSHEGRVQDHWSTLVNPQRDVGPTRIHGITASDVRDAPVFADVAPYLLRAVAGRIIVAHNARFDLRFLASEFSRVGVPLDVLPLPGVCTMTWSTAFLDAPSRRLVDCCRCCGVALTAAHSAGADALATAGLLSHYLAAARYAPPWSDSLALARAYSWPTYRGEYPEMQMLRRQQVRAARQDEWLDRIVARMPRAADARVDSYLALLEMALLDGFLAEHEKDALVAVAAQSGLSRGQVLDVHATYLRAMAEVALEDGVVTADERADLDGVAAALGLRASDVDSALADATRACGIQRDGCGDDRQGLSAAAALTHATIELLPGDRVVFTGDMRRERAEWEERARAAGLEPGGVTKRTKVVVAADPNSRSGKAAKARGYGIPIVTEAAFENLLNSHLTAAAGARTGRI